MTESPPTGNAPQARLDVTTWTYHPQPPATVDATRDRQADRMFTATRAIQWSTGTALLVVLLAVLHVAVPVAVGLLVLCSALGVTASLSTALWHQHLRKHTGVPVIPVLESTLEPTAGMLSSQQEMFELSLAANAQEHFPHLDDKTLRKARRYARRALKSQRKLGRQFIIHAELATQAERRGWERLRNRHARAIGDAVLRLTGASATEPATE